MARPVRGSDAGARQCGGKKKNVAAKRDPSSKTVEEIDSQFARHNASLESVDACIDVLHTVMVEVRGRLENVETTLAQLLAAKETAGAGMSGKVKKEGGRQGRAGAIARYNAKMAQIAPHVELYFPRRF